MAAVSACFFTVTSTKTQSILFCRKPSSFILKYSRVHSFHSSKNLYTRRRSSAHLVRASLDVGVGVRAESDKLPSDVRKRAMDAVDALGRRVTVGDLASKAGLQLTEAQKALQALATDTNGFLEIRCARHKQPGEMLDLGRGITSPNLFPRPLGCCYIHCNQQNSVA
ncbi:hypothetical protein FXO37_31068 [Capsicum annuum]|nr:hypothetical protein FXO37_31068 [Capsicum annuum]